MVKKVLLLLCLSLLFLPMSFASSYVQDDANVFKDPQKIEQELAELSEQLGYPVYIVTTNESYTDTPLRAAAFLLSARVGNNQNGVMLAINFASRDVTLTTSGPDLQEDDISYDKLISIREGIGSRLSDQNYDQAASYYHDQIKKTLGGNYLSIFDFIIAFGSSLVVSIGNVLRGKHKYKPKMKPRHYSVISGAISDRVQDKNVLLDTKTLVRTIPRSNGPRGGSGSGGGSYTAGGGSFRGSSGKF